MGALILDGNAIAKEIANELFQEIENLKKKGITPKLSVILVGENPASVTYVKNKEKKCIELGIISNFDTRIYEVLDSLELSQYFQTITISSLTGVAKPHPTIFLTALEKHHCVPENAWYIGDSIKEDYWGGKSVGMHCYWLNRYQQGIGNRE